MFLIDRGLGLFVAAAEPVLSWLSNLAALWLVNAPGAQAAPGALGAAGLQSGSYQALTVGMEKSPVKIGVRLTFRGGAPCKARRAVITHILAQ